jgi:hypothetical protein
MTEQIETQGDKIQKQPAISSFEAKLFSQGTYVYDEAQVETEGRIELDEYQQFLDRSGRTLDEKDQHLSTHLNMRAKNRRWLRLYSNRIPLSWTDYGKMFDDIQRAKKRKIQLSEGLLDAVIAHPIWYVVMEAATSQKLTPEQIEVVRRADGIARNRFDEITLAQAGLESRQLVRGALR